MKRNLRELVSFEESPILNIDQYTPSSEEQNIEIPSFSRNSLETSLQEFKNSLKRDKHNFTKNCDHVIKRIHQALENIDSEESFRIPEKDQLPA
mmetsp:Transcript_14651/g.21353  ORF Transcript_14651/g.21353 Transcript_14651/m.21353 type:complete len:94 (+) Transcript_14651:470-751(+)